MGKNKKKKVVPKASLRQEVKDLTAELRHLKKEKNAKNRPFDPIADCFLCGSVLKMNDLSIIKEYSDQQKTQFVNFIECSSCHGRYGAFLEIRPDGTARGEFYESEINSAIEFSKFSKEPAVSIDQVLEVFHELRTGKFEDKIKSLVPYGKKQKKGICDKTRR